MAVELHDTQDQQSTGGKQMNVVPLYYSEPGRFSTSTETSERCEVTDDAL